MLKTVWFFFLSILFSSSISFLQSCELRVFNSAPKDVVLDSALFPKSLQPTKGYALPSVLEEISGITYLPTTPDVLYAVQDEDGILYSYDLNQQKVIDRFQFARSGDYEGLTNNGNYFFVLKSNGDIFSFPTSKEDPRPVRHNRSILPTGEYESLAFEPRSNKLYVICKNCKVDKGRQKTTAYSLDILDNGEVNLVQSFEIELSSFAKLDQKIKSFKPSALARHSTKEEWYIISSIDKILVITDLNFIPKRIIPFKRKAFEQPEGLVFDDKSNLFISSEAGNAGYAKIYKFEAM